MKLHRFAFFLLPLVFFAGPRLFGQDLTPEQRKKIENLFKEAQENILKDEFQASNRLLGEVLATLPKGKPAGLDTNRAYVLFVMSGNSVQLKKTAEALEQLESAIDYGFWNSEAIQDDERFAAVRSDKKFSALVAKASRGLGAVGFGVKDINGKELKKKDYAGKVLILDVWGTWCPPCRMEIPHFVRLKKEFKKEGLEIIGLTWERRPPDEFLTEHVRKFAVDNGVNYPLVMLSEARLHSIPNVQGFPTTLFVARDGTVRHRVTGYHDYAALKRIVSRLLDEAPPAKSAQAD